MVTPRAPLQLAGSPGYHWYLVPRVGYPDHDTFHAAREALAELHDGLWEETGDRAGADGARRLLDGGGDELRDGAQRRTGRAVAGILAFSGFVPTVEGWQPRFDDRLGTRAFIAHGRADPIIGDRLRPPRPRAARGRRVWRSSTTSPTLGHQIDPADLAAAAGWVARI